MMARATSEEASHLFPAMRDVPLIRPCAPLARELSVYVLHMLDAFEAGIGLLLIIGILRASFYFSG
jgi:hypothetical protein